MLNRTNHQGDTNQNHIEIIRHGDLLRKHRRDTKPWGGCERAPLYTAGLQISAISVRKIMEVFQKLKIELPYDPTYWVFIQN